MLADMSGFKPRPRATLYPSRDVFLTGGAALGASPPRSPPEDVIVARAGCLFRVFFQKCVSVWYWRPTPRTKSV